MSAKNRLQEYFQRKSLALPVYYSEQIGGPSHVPIWISEVELATGQRIKGEESGSKGAAEQSVALLALASLKRKKEPSRTDLIASSADLPVAKKKESIAEMTFTAKKKEPITSAPLKKEPVRSVHVEEKTALSKGCLLIDGENLPNLAKFASTLVRPRYEILVFIGHHHHLSERDYGPHIQKVLVPTTHANGVDSCMQVYVGTFLLTEKYDQYLIGTRDHFGSALVDLIQSGEMLWIPKTATLVTTESQLKKHL